MMETGMLGVIHLCSRNTQGLPAMIEAKGRDFLGWVHKDRDLMLLMQGAQGQSLVREPDPCATTIVPWHSTVKIKVNSQDHAACRN